MEQTQDTNMGPDPGHDQMGSRSMVSGIGDRPSDIVNILPFEWPMAASLEDGSMASRVIMNRNEQFMYWLVEQYGEFIRAETDIFHAFIEPDSLVLDIGANCGLHTLAMAGLAFAGTVFAVEPQRIPFQFLCGNLALNGCFNVDAARVAVGANPGTIRVPTVNPFVPVNSGGLTLDPTLQDGDMTTMGTLDTAGLPPFRFAKIDVEGMECDVLTGGAGCIREYKPVLYMEFEWNRPKILEALSQLGYVAYRHDAPYYNPYNPKGAPDQTAPGQQDRTLSEVVSTMLLGIHREDRASRNRLEQFYDNSMIIGTIRQVL